MAKFSYQRKWSGTSAVMAALLSISIVIFCSYTLAAFGYDLANRHMIAEMIDSIQEERRDFQISIPALKPPGLQVIQSIFGLGELSLEYTRHLQDFLDLVINAESAFVSPAWQKLDQEIARSSNLDSLEVLPRSKITQLVYNLDSLKREAMTAEALINEQRIKQRLLRDRVRLIRESLAELLGFSKLQFDYLRDEEIAFYQNGVLAGVATIVGVPDDIPDLPSLRDQLAKLHVSVAAQGPDAQELFLNGLNSARGQSEELSQEHSLINSEIQALTRKSTDILASMRTARREIRSVMEQYKGSLVAIRH